MMRKEQRTRGVERERKKLKENFTVSASHGRIIIYLISNQMHEDMKSLVCSYYINSWCQRVCACVCVLLTYVSLWTYNVHKAESISISPLGRQFFLLLLLCFEEYRAKVKGLKMCTTLSALICTFCFFPVYYYVVLSLCPSLSYHSFTVRAARIRHSVHSTVYLSHLGSTIRLNSFCAKEHEKIDYLSITQFRCWCFFCGVLLFSFTTLCLVCHLLRTNCVMCIIINAVNVFIELVDDALRSI